MKAIIDKILGKVEEEFRDRPPTIGVVGVSGVGKSTTINTLFKTQLKTSATIRGTTEFSQNFVGTTLQDGPRKGEKVVFRVMDAPGLGEDITKDGEYLAMYEDNLPLCDVIIWILAARNRAMALDQQYLELLKAHHDRMVFAINQVDLVEPVNWDTQRNMPSEEQFENLKAIVEDRREKIEYVLGRTVKIYPYGAKQHYRVVDLFEGILDACPPKRRWMFDMIKAFSPKDWLDQVQGLSEEEKAELIKRNM